MATDLKTLKALIEVPRLDGTMKSDYKKTEVQLTRFWGGKRGTSLQIGFKGFDGNYSHIQLDNDNCRKLFEELRDHFNF